MVFRWVSLRHEKGREPHGPALSDHRRFARLSAAVRRQVYGAVLDPVDRDRAAVAEIGGAAGLDLLAPAADDVERRAIVAEAGDEDLLLAESRRLADRDPAVASGRIAFADLFGRCGCGVALGRRGACGRIRLFCRGLLRRCGGVIGSRRGAVVAGRGGVAGAAVAGEGHLTVLDRLDCHAATIAGIESRADGDRLAAAAADGEERRAVLDDGGDEDPALAEARRPADRYGLAGGACGGRLFGGRVSSRLGRFGRLGLFRRSRGLGRRVLRGSIGRRLCRCRLGLLCGRRLRLLRLGRGRGRCGGGTLVAAGCSCTGAILRFEIGGAGGHAGQRHLAAIAGVDRAAGRHVLRIAAGDRQRRAAVFGRDRHQLHRIAAEDRRLARQQDRAGVADLACQRCRVAACGIRPALRRGSRCGGDVALQPLDRSGEFVELGGRRIAGLAGAALQRLSERLGAALEVAAHLIETGAQIGDGLLRLRHRVVGGGRRLLAQLRDAGLQFFDLGLHPAGDALHLVAQILLKVVIIGADGPADRNADDPGDDDRYEVRTTHAVSPSQRVPGGAPGIGNVFNRLAVGQGLSTRIRRAGPDREVFSPGR
ncbi:hypothetical protein SI859A1_01246 [Aurantimonas manganoxydans SI85-9A1]|uniref:Uncharacterized protein n=1 Tax=Aurantimonas manganoxydans (strain ATCC BAA-1229 / DSM 21871 / SI85-9A1) TaxID=287752 RepID=Q1YJ73_AURMS|nr:hypothetical protein SI859A1_01246 [Aurantimonas manganoxydans SI85-9A1]